MLSHKRGRDLETRTARAMRGKRTPGSGRHGGNDATIPDDGIWSDWAVETKHRAKLPVFVLNGLMQASLAAMGSRRNPAFVMREEGGRAIFCCYLEDLRPWAEALNEVGNGQVLKGYLRVAKRNIEEALKQL